MVQACGTKKRVATTGWAYECLCRTSVIYCEFNCLTVKQVLLVERNASCQRSAPRVALLCGWALHTPCANGGQWRGTQPVRSRAKGYRYRCVASCPSAIVIALTSTSRSAFFTDGIQRRPPTSIRLPNIVAFTAAGSFHVSIRSLGASFNAFTNSLITVTIASR